jgi:uncharacterized protein
MTIQNERIFQTLYHTTATGVRLTPKRRRSSLLGVVCLVWLASVLGAWTLSASSSAAEAAADPETAQTRALYRSVAVVTGTGEENRRAGFAQCLVDALVKLTGDQTILHDPRLAKLTVSAGLLIQRFSYRDVLEGKPIHDEQGTYDRPHFLTVAFDPAKLDGLARSLGREPWLTPRPRLMVFLAVENARATFMLTSDSTEDRSEDMRSAFAADSEKSGLAVDLPKRSELEARGWSAKSLPEIGLSQLAGVAGRDAPLAGRIVFREEALGWIADWRLLHGGKVYQWGVRGINFDGAFRNALFGAAQILSGHGQPR